MRDPGTLGGDLEGSNNSFRTLGNPGRMAWCLPSSQLQQYLVGVQKISLEDEERRPLHQQVWSGMRPVWGDLRLTGSPTLMLMGKRKEVSSMMVPRK